MKNERPMKWWMIAAALAVAVLAITSLAICLLSSGPPAEVQALSQSVTVQWKPQSITETKLLAKIEADNKTLIKKLKDMANSPGSQDLGEWTKEFSGTYLRKPRLWTDEPGSFEDWANVFNKLKNVVGGKPDVNIDALHVLIEYLPYVEGSDYDLLAHIKITFSCSSGEDPILEGELRHRKVCIWEP